MSTILKSLSAKPFIACVNIFIFAYPHPNDISG